MVARRLESNTFKQFPKETTVSSRKFFLCLVASCAVAMTVPATLLAQEYPYKQLRIIVPYPPGGTVDAAARVIGRRLAETIGQPVLIDNKAGANGTIGADAVAKAAADGYTLLLVPSAHVINPAVMLNMPFDVAKDFTPVSIIGTLPLVFISGPQQPFKTLQEMVAYAKAKPGQLSLGYTDSSTQLVGVMLKQATGIDIQLIGYKGGSAMVVDIIGGHVQVGATGAGSAYPHYKAGTVRVLGVTESKRAPAMPEVPTVAEGGVPGFNAQVWLALLGPAGMSPANVDRLHSELVKIIAEPQLSARLSELGNVPRVLSPAETAAVIKADTEMWAKAARDAGLKRQ